MSSDSYGICLFSDGKLDYLILAIETVVFSEIQSKMFVWGSVVSPSVYFGFLAEKKSLPGIAVYLFEISGIVFLGVLVLLFFLKKNGKSSCSEYTFPNNLCICGVSYTRYKRES